MLVSVLRHAAILCAALLAMTGPVPALAAEDSATFVGSQACAGCHAAETSAWAGSHHALAMQPATEATVLGDFSGTTFEHDGVTTAFYRAEGKYMVRTDGPGGSQQAFPVAYTFGVAPLQQYLIGFPDGRYQALGIAWDSRPRDQGGQRWFHLYPAQHLAAGDRLHWTGRDQTWNYQCATCHSTNVQKNFNLATNTYATTFSGVNVGCEACHGPASRHLAWAQATAPLPAGLRKGLTTWLQAEDRGVWEMNTQTGIARRTEPPASAAVIDACGGCHARRSVLANGNTAATAFLDGHAPALLEPGLYHADGQIDGEVFELGAFLQSKMARAGVTCTNCHEPHAGGLRAQGNALCAQCHMPQKFDVAEHHHHEPASAGAQCANCHMPAKTYMGVDVRHDHSFRVPRPDLTLELGVPNTCSQCHTNQSPEWAARTVAGWYPQGRQAMPHYGRALHAGRTGAVDAEAQLDALILDPAAPGIARATALSLLARYSSTASEAAVRTAITDPDPLVRSAALRALPPSLSASMVRAAVPLLTDPVRTVRIEAARVLAGTDAGALTPEQRTVLARAIRETAAAQMVDADRPEAHLNLGLLEIKQRHQNEADAEYRTALRLDPAFVPALVNLADLDRMRGMDQQGAERLRTAISIEPGNAAIRHSLGLLLVRQRKSAEALTLLREATELAPENARYAYVYAVALNSAGDHDGALALLKRTHQTHPAEADVLQALVAIARDNGDLATALQYARELAAQRPGDAQLGRLVRGLELQQAR